MCTLPDVAVLCCYEQFRVGIPPAGVAGDKGTKGQSDTTHMLLHMVMNRWWAVAPKQRPGNSSSTEEQEST